MASVSRVELIPNQSLTSNLTGSTKVLEPHQVDHVAWLNVDSNAGTTVDVDIEHSGDNVNFVTLASFSQVAGGSGPVGQALQITDSILPYVRAVVTLGGALTATLDVGLYHDKRR